MTSSRKANRQGHTYKRGSSYRTVIKVNGRVISASGKSKEESRRLAKARLTEVGQNLEKLIPSTNITLSDYLLNWLENDHKHFLAPTTYRRYLSIAINHIQPSIGHLDLTEVTSREINNLLLNMREKGQSPRSAQQTRAVLSVCLNAAMNDEIRELQNFEEEQIASGKIFDTNYYVIVSQIKQKYEQLRNEL